MARSIPLNPHSLPPLGVRLRQGARRVLRQTWRWRRAVLRPRLPALPRHGVLGVRWRWILVMVLLMGGEWLWLSGHQPAPAAHQTGHPAPGHADHGLLADGRTSAAARSGSVPPRAVAGGGTATTETRWVAVTGTGGEGVYLRRVPRRAEPLAVWPEGTELEVVGGTLLSGAGSAGAQNGWLRVRDPAGRVGYMTARYLVPAPAPRPVRVGNTGGQGVYVRRTPWLAVHVRAWPDGTPLAAYGSESDAVGEEWTYVRDPAGNLGWVPARYLVR